MRLRRRPLTLFAAGLIAGAALAWTAFGPRYQIVSGGANSVFGYARIDTRTGQTHFFLFNGQLLGEHPKPANPFDKFDPKKNWWEADKLAKPFDPAAYLADDAKPFDPFAEGLAVEDKPKAGEKPKASTTDDILGPAPKAPARK